MTKKNLALTYKDFIKSVQKYIKNDEELELIKKTYEYAEKMHFGVKRLTGEDYIEHPLNVAYILTETEADTPTLCAALLHDVLEDCNVTKEELIKEFGIEIVNLVDGVTKINKISFDSSTSSNIATQRKILVGLTEDVRVIFIKLADRLHNMRTLWVHNEKKQKEKAKETLDLLTPIAHRLGMNSIKSELEDLSLRYYKPDIYFDIVKQLNQTKTQRDKSVVVMKEAVSELLNNSNIEHSIKGRAKSIYSIYKKLDKGKQFNDIYDLLALRVYVNTEQECYQALGIIHSKYKPIPKRFKDYIAMPKTNMYQSLHTTVFGYDSELYEIQIRTYAMDEIAERGIACHWSFKEKTKANLQNEMEQKLQIFRSIMELNSEESNDEEFIRNVKEDVFKNTIYVFTPKGDVIELPNGSTPIDFAYRVHSGVGDKMVGAIVNNNIVPLDYVLKDNDIIKINTNKNSLGPSYEWINIAHTAQAKNKIKAFFKKIDKEEYLKKGEEILLKELKKKKLVISEFLSKQNIEKILEEFKLDTLDDLYVDIGNNRVPVGTVINSVTTLTNTKEEIILRKTQNNEEVIPTVKTDIVIGGLSDIKVNIASCCKPIPGDSVIGYITKGYGISVHRNVCPNIKETEERIIDVKWNDFIEKKYPTTIIVKALKNDNLLLDVIAKTSASKITIQSINTYNGLDEVTFKITILVNNKELLKKFMNDLKSISDILEVERLIK